MAIRCEYEGRRFENVDVSDGASVVYVETYRLNNDDFLLFQTFIPRKGRVVLRRPAFVLESASAKIIAGPTPRGEIVVEVEYRAGPLQREQQTDQNGNETSDETPPWLYRVENWKASTATEETTPAYYYPATSNVPAPFVNTAGVPLQATATRGLTDVSFSYNVRSINASALTTFRDAINAFPITVAGDFYAARTLKIEQIDATLKEDRATDGSVLWRYYTINVRFLCDPQTWNRDFLNVGTRVADVANGGLRRIWSWTDANGKIVYGSYQNGLNACAQDLATVDEPLFLTPDGTNISPFDASGRQIPTYLTGSVYRPVDFSPLLLPSVR